MGRSLGMAAIGFAALLLLSGCGLLGLAFGGTDDWLFGGGDVDPVEYGDPSASGTEPFDEEAIEPLVPDPDTGVYTIYIRDRATDQPISTDVTINIRYGVASAVDSNGMFTVTPTGDEIPEMQILVTGYSVGVYPDYDFSNDLNYVYKEKLHDDVFGEWILYKVEDRSTGESYDVYDETVTFKEDGTVRWSGDRVYADPEYYYSTRMNDNGTIGFGSRNRIIWQSVTWVGDTSIDDVAFLLHAGIPLYYVDDDVFSIGATGPLAPDHTLWYSRDGLDPDANGGNGGSESSGEVSGTVSFRGSSSAAVAYNGGSGVWSVTADDYTIAVINAPADSSASLGSGAYTGSDLDEPGVQVVDSTDYTQYVSISGSIQTSGSSLSINATMKELTDVVLGTGSSYSLSFTAD